MAQLGRVVTMYHGTSSERAISIQQNGFRCSESGHLGSGVYFACSSKARNFAADAMKRGHGNGEGAVLQCLVNVNFCHFSHDGECTDWSPSFDAAYAPCTPSSTRPEWCISNPQNVTVEKIYHLRDGYPSYLGDPENESLRVFEQIYSSYLRESCEASSFECNFDDFY